MAEKIQRWFQLSGRERWANNITSRKISICSTTSSTPSPLAATAMLTAAVAHGKVVWINVVSGLSCFKSSLQRLRAESLSDLVSDS